MKIAVVGLGYVGLPLAVEFGKKHMTVGFDINQARVNELNSGIDSTLEVANEELKEVIAPTQDYNDDGLFITTNLEDLKACNFYIITVPTPTDKNNRPVLTPLKKASESIGKVLKKGDYVVYESTVYPGATEEECIPVLEQVSGLKFNEDFFVGYSPERINPGDKKHTVTKILKVTSGSTPEIAKQVEKLENGMSFLASIGSVGPFIGLLGTVWGIVNAFQSIAISNNTSLAVVAPGIAEALFATALGLLAAIPAVAAYNKFSNDLDKITSNLEYFSIEFLSKKLNEMEKKHNV